MVQLDEFLQPKYETDHLGFSVASPQFIPEQYLQEKMFLVWRTCHSFGDWAIISAMPRLLKKKYPDAIIAVPSPTMVEKLYPNGIWSNKHEKFHNNVAEVFANNPYVDGMIDDLPFGNGIYHDHFRIYDPSVPNTPLTEQMLRYWRFDPKEITDSAPELYWSPQERQEGYVVVAKLFKGDSFGFLYIDDSFLETCDQNPPKEPLDYKRKRIQQIIDYYQGLKWLYYAGKDISETPYKTYTETIDVRSLGVSLRVQSYIKSLSHVIIGHQGGYGTDCMSRYPIEGCHVVPLAAKHINEHFIRTTSYLFP